MRVRIAVANPNEREKRVFSVSGSVTLKVAFVAAAALLTANCSSQTAVSKVDPKYGVAPSPVRVSDGKDIPRGGGRSMVGRPYTIAGRTFVPTVDENYSREGLASWYGPNFHGRQTANGEVFDKYSVSAAHPTMPLPSYARVTNLANDRSVIVRVNDRGPFHGNRIIDVSKTVAEALDFRHLGVSRVRVDYVGPASVHGSDDRTLISTLRTDGMLAQLPTSGSTPAPVMIASAEPTPRVPAARETGPAAPAILAYVDTPTPSRQRVASTEVPLPPSRPAEFNVALRSTLARASTPETASNSRTTVAGIFFAEPARATSSFVKGAPFDNLAPLDLASLRRTR
jgi:rare lipoprotein A